MNYKESLENIVKNQTQLFEQFDLLYKRPIACSDEELLNWQTNNVEYLRAKAEKVYEAPMELKDSITNILDAGKDLYYGFVEFWYKEMFKDYQEFKLYELLDANKISQIEFEKQYKELKEKDFNLNYNQNEAVNIFFKVFDELIESIKIDNGSDYFMFSGIRGDGFVHNILTLEIFCIILPNADKRNKDIYIELAKIIIICFFTEKLAKFGFDNDKVNPCKSIFKLDEIYSYYEYLNSIKEN